MVWSTRGFKPTALAVGLLTCSFIRRLFHYHSVSCLLVRKSEICRWQAALSFLRNAFMARFTHICMNRAVAQRFASNVSSFNVSIFHKECIVLSSSNLACFFKISISYCLKLCEKRYDKTRRDTYAKCGRTDIN